MEQNLLGSQPYYLQTSLCNFLKGCVFPAHQRPVGNFHICFAFYILQKELSILFINGTHLCTTTNITFAVNSAGQTPSLHVAAQPS